MTDHKICDIIKTQRAREGKARSEAHESRVRPDPKTPTARSPVAAVYKCEPSAKNATPKLWKGDGRTS